MLACLKGVCQRAFAISPGQPGAGEAPCARTEHRNGGGVHNSLHLLFLIQWIQHRMMWRACAMTLLLALSFPSRLAGATILIIPAYLYLAIARSLEKADNSIRCHAKRRGLQSRLLRMHAHCGLIQAKAR